MKLKFIKENNLNIIKSNLELVYSDVFINKTKTLNDMLNSEFLQESNVETKKFTLDLSSPQNRSNETDYNNIKIVYDNLKFLSDSQASDERIWAAYTFGEHFDYMSYRWPLINVEVLSNRYLFGYSIQRSLFRNGIARLWWIGRVTYNENYENPYELTEFICKNQNYIESICGRNIFNNRDICHTLLKVLYDAEKNSIKVNSDTIKSVTKSINLIGGTYLLDTFSENELYKKIADKIGLEGNNNDL